jgi:hypothetical protein
MGLRENLVALGMSMPEDFGTELDRWAAKLGESPCRNTATLVGMSTVMFYLLEKNRNPKVNDIWDAMVYCSTCLSVGYGDIFAKTPLGKILGSTLMTMGPAMAAKTLDGEADGRRDAVQEEVLETLKQILDKIEGEAPSNM